MFNLYLITKDYFVFYFLTYRIPMSTLFKKVTSAMTVGAVIASTLATSIVAAASGFLPYAEALADAKVITKSSTEAGYRLADNALRQEVAGMMMALNKATYADNFACANKFSDVSATKPNSWICKIVETALSKGLISANAKFRPEDKITRAEALAMILKGQGIEITAASKSSFNDVKEGWQVNVTETALAKKIISANASFRPNDNITRGELFVLAANAAGLKIATDDLNLDDLFGDTTTSTGTTTTDTTTTTTTDTTVVKAGDLNVSLNPASPASQSVPQSGTVTFGKFDVKAASSDITLNSVQFAREGLGNRSDIQRVWMELNGVRVTGRQSVGSDNTVAVTFSPALVIKAGATQALDLVATLSGTTTGGQHRFTIASTSNIVSSSSTVGGTYPMSTATMTTAAYTVIPVAFQAVGSASTYKVGDKQVEVGQFKLTNNATDDKNATFKSITLRNDGTGDAAKNLLNLSVYKAGVKVSNGVTFDSKKMTFAISDTLGFGRTETYYVKADVDSVSNTTGDNYILTLQNTDDINVSEAATGFKATITTSGTAATYSITGGDLILSKSSTAPSAQTVAPGTNDVVLLSADLKVAQAVNLQDLTAYFIDDTTYSGTMAEVSSAFSSLKLKIGNSVVSTVTPSSSTSTGILFDGTFTVGANTTLSILGNLRSAYTGAKKFKINDLAITNFAVKEYAANGNSIQSAQIVGSAAGSATTVGTATITITRNDGIADQNLAVGSNTVTGMKFTMKASDVSDVTVTKIKVGTSTGTINLANVTSAQLFVDGVQKSEKSMSSGYADFSDVNFTIAKNTSVVIEVKVSFSTAISNSQFVKLNLNTIEARDVNSISLASSSFTPSTLTNVVGPLYTFITAGSATVALNSSSPNASILVPSSSETEVARFTLGATDDDLQLTDMYVYNTGTADLAARVKTASLYDAAGNKLSVGTVVGTGTIAFAISSDKYLTIAKNTSNTAVVVKLSFNDLTDGAQSNKSVYLGVGYKSDVSPVSGTSTGGLRLVSKSTGNTVTTVTGTPLAAQHLLVRSKPTVAVSGAATLTNHTFTVTADANNRLTLTGITVSLSNPSAATGTFTVYKDTEVTGNAIATGSILPNGTVTFAYFTSTEISAGTSKTFIFKVSNELTSATVNSKRIFKVTDLGFQDQTDTNGPISISSVSSYSNVGLPTAESTFTY